MEKVVSMKSVEELRAYVREYFFSMQNKAEDEALIRQKFPKRWFWFLTFLGGFFCNIFVVYKAFSYYLFPATS